MLIIGIIREGKVPSDSRVVLTPRQCVEAEAHFPVKIRVQPSETRCFSDEAYREVGIEVQDNMVECDLLLGVKEVPIDQLIPEKSYCFFSHTIKGQAYNRKLLQHVLAQNITLVDYEVLTDEQGKRVIAFGYFAGMVGAHNAVRAYLRRVQGAHLLPALHTLSSYKEVLPIYQNLTIPPVRIVLTGSGRVGQGALRVLRDMNIRQISPKAFLQGEGAGEAVFSQLACADYVETKDGSDFNRQEFYDHPDRFQSSFSPFTKVCDVLINGIYWDKRAPAFFTIEQMRQPEFRIQVIGDITCDIAPESSIPSTVRASTIESPVYGFNPHSGLETEPYREGNVDVMAIDNLPNELPRDASESFGNQFLEYVLPGFLRKGDPMIQRATIAEKGCLGSNFRYLEDYVQESEKHD